MCLHEESVTNILLETGKWRKKKKKKPQEEKVTGSSMHLLAAPYLFSQSQKDIWDARLPACKQHKCWSQTLQNLYIIQEVEVFRGGEWSFTMRETLQHNRSRKLFHIGDIRSAYILEKKKVEKKSHTTKITEEPSV